MTETYCYNFYSADSLTDVEIFFSMATQIGIKYDIMVKEAGYYVCITDFSGQEDYYKMLIPSIENRFCTKVNFCKYDSETK